MGVAHIGELQAPGEAVDIAEAHQRPGHTGQNKYGQRAQPAPTIGGVTLFDD